MVVTAAAAVSAFGTSLKAKLSGSAIQGAPEDQLRAPLEKLIRDLGEVAGLLVGAVDLVGETTLHDLKTRPDYAVTVGGVLVGFIEVKAPGKGANPGKFADPHDRDQWAKLKALPNLLYTDGNAFSLWRNGGIEGRIVTLDGDVETSGAKLKAPDTLLPLINGFLTWDPIPPENARQLAEVSARLCRFLRDEVTEQMALGSPGLTALASDWRKLLFPDADNAKFADGYAQAVTFGLLVARAGGISFDGGIEAAAAQLRKTNSLIGTALRLLTDSEENKESLKTSLGTLTRVLNAVDWAKISKGSADAWLYFYEDFLEVYDNRLRRLTGSYYTPPEVVEAMVRLVDEVLRGPLFGEPDGLASSQVTVADPAVGTGTYLLGVLRRIAATVEEDQGAGAVRGAVEAASKRVIGFELQFGPFAVAQLRLIAEMQTLMKGTGKALPKVPELQLFITDTLGNPFVEDETFVSMVEAVAKSRRDANKVKKAQSITVVIGNPPYRNRAGGLGSWIESGSSGRPSAIDRWLPPPEWRIGVHAHHLRNLYIYFWRWATLQVFGSGWHTSTGLPDRDRAGVVCFITVAGFLNGPGFQRMRDDLRRTCSDIWVVDCSPDGHQPEVATRIFQGVQQPVCIVLAARKLGKGQDVPARVHFHALPNGRREAKFEAMATLSLDGSGWRRGAGGWRDPFLPEQIGEWADFPRLADLFNESSPGVKTHRTWVIAPDAKSLAERWNALRRERQPEQKEILFHADPDRDTQKIIDVSLGSHPLRLVSVARDDEPVIPPARYAFRSLDRQWIVPDHRLINRARPALWAEWSINQVYLTALEAHSPRSGPAVSFAGLVPDNDHYKGSFGGRVYPLWRDAAATQPNVRPALLLYLADIYFHAVAAEDMVAYLAALMAHPAFTARFAADLVRPGLRVPLTGDRALFEEAVALGREVVWLHCYGERFADPAAGRPRKAPRLPAGERPTIPAYGEIPGAPEPLPDVMTYDAGKQRLNIGTGYVEKVTPAMWAYEVSGKNVLRQWFSYRRRDRSRPVIGDRRPPSALDKIQPASWPAEYTSDLLDLLNVLGRLVKLEPAQADLLQRICAGPLLSSAGLLKAGAIAPKPGSEAA